MNNRTLRNTLLVLALAAIVAWLPACAMDSADRQQVSTKATDAASSPAAVPPASLTSTPSTAPSSALPTASRTDLPGTPTVPAVTTAPPTLQPTIATVTAPSALPTPSPRPTATPAPTATTAPKPTAVPTGDGRVTLAADSRFYYKKLDAALKARITGMSYPANDPNVRIGYDDLRYISLRHIDFAGQEHAGELIVNARLAKEVMQMFYELYKARYPLASVRLVDDFGEPGDDNKSMAANNTSAFNYRRVTGTTTLSRHSLGAAIDINPLFNPYLHDGLVSPPGAAPYVDRSRDFPGKIDHDDTCYKLFRRYDWSWGGDWSGDKDYQHFSKSVT